MTRWKAGLCMVGLWLGMGCGADDLPETTADESVTSTEEGLSDGSLFFAARPDLRRCASPMCGGSFVRALNREHTTCVDGTKAAECYVANLDLSPTGLPAGTQQELIGAQRKVIFVGAIRPSDSFRGFGTLVTKEAWLGVNDTPASTTLLTKNNGIVCIKAPCPSFSGELVNRNREFMLALDLSGLRASDADRDRVQQALQKDGALLSGRFARYGQPAQLFPTQAYLRVRGPVTRACGSRGLPLCAPGEFCRFEPGTCGELDHPGFCTRRPQVCPQIFNPVCGCDGKTYPNSCVAAVAGASVSHPGACKPVPEPVICGGIFPRPCPGAGTCVFEKCPLGAKSCPVCADCTGVCECSGAAVLCGPGTMFDDSPSVCACVPIVK